MTADRGAARGVVSSLAAERLDYRAGTLPDELFTGEDVAAGPVTEPFALLRAWMDDAFARRDAHGDLPEPTAVTLSTVDMSSGSPRPRSRTVLLKELDESGLVVYTHRDSAKGRELAATPWASMLIAHLPLQRQVRIDGPIELVADADADAYWASRPRDSQLGSAASEQSRPIASRAALDARFAALAAAHEEREVPRPSGWGGYRLVPDHIEFWQGRHGRLHDRIVFTRSTPDAPWSRERLQP